MKILNRLLFVLILFLFLTTVCIQFFGEPTYSTNELIVIVMVVIVLNNWINKDEL